MDDHAGKSDERRPVTILFTDIVGSTTHAEKLDAEEWKEIVNGAHRRLSEQVTRYDGTVAQLLGDGVLAFFGAPNAHEDDPARAVRAGLGIQRAISEYANDLRGMVENFQMRVGIHTGEVVVGQVGSAEHSEYLAVGDAMNLAARLQSAAQPGTVLISEATARLVQAVFDLRDLGEISVKGKAEPIRVFEAIAQRANFSSGRGIAGISSSLVGRARELKQLTDALNELRAGQGQIVFVLGEAGIGKSRLVEEAEHWADTEPGSMPTQWLAGRALSYGQSLSFWTITQLLQNDLGIADGEHEIKIRVALRKRVQELLGEKSDEIFPYLAQLLGVKLEGDAAERVKSLDGETLKRQVLISVGEYFLKLAQQQPTVLVLEDLHWADPSSLDALERLLRVTERAPLMILVLMRAETDKPAWRIREIAAREYRRRFHEIELEPLTASDASELINNLLAISDLPDVLRKLILERAEGNPFYLEEILRALMEQGAIVRDENNHWRATQNISNVKIPETLQALLLSRIDRLEDDVKRTLQLASVIGRSFLFKLLDAISDAERELDWHLAQLERADLVHEKTRLPELEYMFKHSLTQEAAYESLVRERRQEFHRRVANALENIFAERQDEFLGLLAYHFDRAGDKEKAIDYLLRAGDETRLSDAHVEAIGFYERARDLLLETGAASTPSAQDLERAAKTWLKLGLIYQANFEFEKAHEANERAFELRQETRRHASRSSGVTECAEEPARVFRYCRDFGIGTLDPGLAVWPWEAQIIYAVFAGLAEVDPDLNVLPHVARSWEVREGGKRYVLHLRDDFYWTDGSPVTAHDFEWTWKRNLSPSTRAAYAEDLDIVEGARDFRQGLVGDPDTVAVRALDALTLDVKLVKPVAYFPYLLALPITFPLLRRVVETYGAEWYKPEHIISNGSFRLVKLDGSHATLERNPNYVGEFSGNLDRVEAQFIQNPLERVQKFLADEVDACMVASRDVPNLDELADPAEQHRSAGFDTTDFVLTPEQPPLDDVRVRRALVHALDRQRLVNILRGPGFPSARSGMIPPGIPGHSPEIGLAFDIPLAERLLTKAGFPRGASFPNLVLGYWEGVKPLAEDMARQWREHLGIIVSAEFFLEEKQKPGLWPGFRISGWVADYPDPDNFLRAALGVNELGRGAWQYERFATLVEEAASMTDRASRMALYREADRLWVAEDVVICPLAYEGDSHEPRLLKRWVKNCKPVPLGYIHFKDVRIEPH